MCSTCQAHQEALDAISGTLRIIRELPDPNVQAKAYLELIEEIPGGGPDGTGIFTPIGWVRWAKQQLGYKR